jgi:hypothetical protein
MNINTVGTNNTIANNAINTITSAGIYGITTDARPVIFVKYN